MAVFCQTQLTGQMQLPARRLPRVDLGPSSSPSHWWNPWGYIKMLKEIEGSPYTLLSDTLWEQARDAQRTTWGLMALAPTAFAAGYYAGPAAGLMLGQGFWETITRHRSLVSERDRSRGHAFRAMGYAPMACMRDLHNNWQESMMWKADDESERQSQYQYNVSS